MLPVIEALAGEVRVCRSTPRKPAVARAAVAAGATLINDVSADAVARWPPSSGVGCVAMHSRARPHTMQVDPRYDDVVAEVDGLPRPSTPTRAAAAGVDRDLGRSRASASARPPSTT